MAGASLQPVGSAARAALLKAPAPKPAPKPLPRALPKPLPWHEYPEPHPAWTPDGVRGLGPALVDERLMCPNAGHLTSPRFGILLHFDDSSEDYWAVEWFTESGCQVSYNWLVLDDGRCVEIVAPWGRAWHAGVCRTTPETRDANSAYYGISAATNTKVPVTAAQEDRIVALAVQIFRAHGWPASDVTRRITGHDRIAVYPPGHPKAGQLGRKIDPTGIDARGALRTLDPILSVERVRARVAAQLHDSSTTITNTARPAPGR